MRTVFALVAATAILAPPSPAYALGRDEVVARAIAAQGGADKLRAIRSLRVTGIMHLGGEGFSLDAQVGTLYQRDGRVRTEFTLQGLTAVDAYDGNEGWSIQPFEGRREAQRAIRRRRQARMAQDADIDGPLVDWRAEGPPRRLPRHRGRRRHRRRTSCASRARTATSSTSTSTRTRSSRSAIGAAVRSVRGVEQVTRDRLGDYEQVAGVWIPFSIETGPQGRARRPAA